MIGPCGFHDCTRPGVVQANGVNACQTHIDWAMEMAFAGVRELFRSIREIAHE